MTDKTSISETQSERDMIRQLLLDAGMLVTDIEIPEIPDGYTSGEIEAMFPIQLPADAQTWAKMLDEERGEY